MYSAHFGFSSLPFSINPDSQLTYIGTSFARARENVLRSLRAKQRCIVVTGEPGGGKTTLLMHLMERAAPTLEYVYVPYAGFSFGEIVNVACERLELSVAERDTKEKIDALIGHLVRRRRQGHTTVLVVDEAQNLTAETLQELLALANDADPGEPLLQLLLAGQAALVEQAKAVEGALTEHCKIAYCRLQSLAPPEVSDYIRYRLQSAGADETELFTPEAIGLIAEHTGGIPRLINAVGGYALLIAYEDSAIEVNEDMIVETIDNLAPGFEDGEEQSQPVEPAAVLAEEDLQQTDTGGATDTGMRWKPLAFDERHATASRAQFVADELGDLSDDATRLIPVQDRPTLRSTAAASVRRSGRRRRRKKAARARLIGVAATATLAAFAVFFWYAFERTGRTPRPVPPTAALEASAAPEALAAVNESAELPVTTPPLNDDRAAVSPDPAATPKQHAATATVATADAEYVDVVLSAGGAIKPDAAAVAAAPPADDGKSQSLEDLGNLAAASDNRPDFQLTPTASLSAEDSTSTTAENSAQLTNTPEPLAQNEFADETIAMTATVATQPSANAATIRSGNDFVTCTKVVERSPVGVGDSFGGGRVYAFARVHAPRDETLTLSWHTASGAFLSRLELKVRQNQGAGYRTYGWKTIYEPGPYEVRLYNDSNDLIAQREFIVQ